ncbi:MAG: polyhydroxybutyrate depolymerase [Solirubrobacteraceae bacterium]|nr:polyhydroxybutyrate depolymerase [Solirubrobacteraceae bacterium]
MGDVERGLIAGFPDPDRRLTGAGLQSSDVRSRPLAVVPPAVALALILAACGGGGDGAGTTARPETAAATRAADVTQTQQASCSNSGLKTVEGGVLRMPSGAQPGATPLLVVVVPGGDGDSDDRLTIGGAAGREGVAVLYPTSPGSGFWQLNDAFGTSDVTAVSALLERQLAGGCFDEDRVSITGVSNGAGFAARMGCELPTRFAAVVPVSAGYRALDPCPGNARASFLAIHGTADTVTPFNGKKPDRKGNVPRYTARWAKRDGCAATPRASTPRRLVTRFTYRGCDSGLRVELLRLSGTDHGWPGAGPPLPDRNPSRLSATREVLRFIRAARRPDA